MAEAAIVVHRDAAGTLHRLDGPAVLWSDGSRQWFVHGRPHRLDGPAFIGATGVEEWWVCGTEVSGRLAAAIVEFDLPLPDAWTPAEWLWFRLWASGFQNSEFSTDH